jgi:hypothetical protein
MDLCSFLEHKRKCPNLDKNKVITVYQGGFLSQLDNFSMYSTSIYHSLAPTWHAPYKSTEVTLRYQIPFFNKSRFEVLESLWWNRMPTNTLLSLSHTCSMGLTLELTTCIVVHEYEFRTNTICYSQHML